MKSKEEILTNKYVLVRDGVEYAFGKRTPKDCAEALLDCYRSGVRVVLDYGDEKGSWGEGARLLHAEKGGFEITEWMEIEYDGEAEYEEYEQVIDKDGYNIPLGLVMRVY